MNAQILCLVPLVVAGVLTGCAQTGSNTSSVTNDISASAVTVHFADMAHAMLEDSLVTAKTLQTSIDHFIVQPTEANLELAKAAYVEARVPYQQSEILRFDIENGHVTEGLDVDGGPASVDDWEGQLNAWPLDEALIDYVDTASYAGEYGESINIINALGNITVAGQTMNAAELTPDTLVGFNEIGGSEANVATGYHAIEFLLWGQDTNGTGPGAGQRPVSDYFTKAEQGACTSGKTTAGQIICKRRAQYLQAAAQLLVNDLQEMTNEWVPGAGKGTLRHDFLSRGDGLRRIVDSMGDMAIGELASERMKVAILFGSTEDEHDCFSDATHVAIFNNAQGVMNAYTGEYKRVNGEIMQGPSLAALVAAKDPALHKNLQAQLDEALKRMQKIVDTANSGKKFDQLVGGSQADKQIVLDAAASLTALDEPLSDGVGKLLALELAEFDPGTCPTQDAKDCES